ncbi:MAG: hypothetical protein ACOYIT_07820 [Christensenellales bacterium]|jgi:preprotein translocase subunit SecF
MNNKLKKSLTISVLIILAGAILALAGIALPFEGSAKYAVEFPQIWLCMLASVVFALLFGFARVDRAHAAAMSLALLNDFLLSLSVTAIASLIIKGVSEMPAAVVFPITMMLSFVFSFAQSTVVLRSANRLMRTTTRKEKPLEQIAEEAPKASMKGRIGMLIVSFVFLLALAFGGKKLIPIAAPLMLSSLVAFFTSGCITAQIWAIFTKKFKFKQ